jgi:hypothetical protein
LRQQQTEISSANAELTKISNLIQDNEKEGIDTQKLEKKAADIKQRISKLAEEHQASSALITARQAAEAARKEIELADKEHEVCSSQSVLAEGLKKSFEAASSHGAIEALVYETLDEAVSEYVANIPMVISISKAMTIDRVALWLTPDISEAEQYELSAAKGKVYRYSRIPDSLRWLQRFPKTKYTSMPAGDSSVVVSEGIPFLVGVDVAAKKSTNEGVSEEGAEEEGSGTDASKWMGDMKSYYHNGHAYGRQLLPAPSHSIYLPDGISNPNRSGLCYIKSECKFYAVWNEGFPMVEMVPGKIQKKDYYNRIVEEDALVPKGVEVDMSGLLNDFFSPVEKRIKVSAKGFAELDKSEDPLVKRAGSWRSRCPV